MAIRRLSTASIKTGSKSNKLWDQDTQQGAMVPIASFVLNMYANITMANIPQTFQDLMVVISHTSQQPGSLDDYMYFGQSGITGGNYSVTRLTGDGATAASDRTTTTDGAYAAIRPANSANLFGSAIYHILNYANTTTFKTILIRNAADKNGSGVAQLSVATMRSTSAITSLLIGGTGNYPGSGTTVTIYGIKAGA